MWSQLNQSSNQWKGKLIYFFLGLDVICEIVVFFREFRCGGYPIPFAIKKTKKSIACYTNYNYNNCD